jgi:ribosomal protein L7/L12
MWNLEWLWAGLAGFVLALLIPRGGGGNASALEPRLGRLERKVDQLLQHFEIAAAPVPGLPTEVPAAGQDALMAGQKIIAIKELRTAAPHLGLKEAKDQVEEWESRMNLHR